MNMGDQSGNFLGGDQSWRDGAASGGARSGDAQGGSDPQGWSRPPDGAASRADSDFTSDFTAGSAPQPASMRDGAPPQGSAPHQGPMPGQDEEWAPQFGATDGRQSEHGSGSGRRPLSWPQVLQRALGLVVPLVFLGFWWRMGGSHFGSFGMIFVVMFIAIAVGKMFRRR